MQLILNHVSNSYKKTPKEAITEYELTPDFLIPEKQVSYSILTHFSSYHQNHHNIVTLSTCTHSWYSLAEIFSETPLQVKVFTAINNAT